MEELNCEGVKELVKGVSRSEIGRYTVFTCVMGGYDLVLPPMCLNQEIDYWLITDDPNIRVAGWQRILVNIPETFRNPTYINRCFKFFPHLIFPNYKVSLYLDGNVRIKSDLMPFFLEFESTGKCMGLLKHPLRETIMEEILACRRQARINNNGEVIDLYLKMIRDGFNDDVRLSENNAILRNHCDKRVIETMELWWSSLCRGVARDQIHLPYVLWKTKLPVHYFEWCARTENTYFNTYYHLKGDSNRKALVLISDFIARKPWLLKLISKFN